MKHQDFVDVRIDLREELYYLQKLASSAHENNYFIECAEIQKRIYSLEDEMEKTLTNYLLQQDIHSSDESPEKP